MAPAINVNGIKGRPGISPTKNIKKLAIVTVLGFPSNCSERSLLKLPSDATLETIIPDAVEINSAGIWDTKPSPTVSNVYCEAASAILRPF